MNINKKKILLLSLLTMALLVSLIQLSSAQVANPVLSVSVSPVGAGTVSPNGGSYAEGTHVTLTATANPGYTFHHWEINSNPFVFTSSVEYTVLPSGNSIKAAFYQNVILNPEVAPTGSGTVSLSPDNGANGYSWGDKVTLTATANPGYTFHHWEINSNPFVFTSSVEYTVLPAGNSIKAIFVANPVLTVSVFPDGAGSVSPNGGSYAEGTHVTLTATANSGYTFKGWLINGATSLTYGNPLDYAMLSSGNSIQAVFVANPVTHTITFIAKGLPSGTTWSVTLGSTTLSSTTNTVIFDVTDGSYSWTTPLTISGDSGVQFKASTTSGTISVPTQTSQEISFETQYLVTFASSSAVAGTVPANRWVDAGTTTTLSATANTGYVFGYWKGDYSSNDKDAVITVNAPMSIIAEFYAVNGGLSPSSNDGTYKDGSTIPVKFTLTDAKTGQNIIVTAQISIVDQNGKDITAVASGSSNIGELFRYDASSNQFIFNLSTKLTDVNAGQTYSVWATLSNEETFKLSTFTLR
jgi:hypothetical protein